LFLTADHHLFFVSNRRINAAIFSQISHSWSSVAAKRFVEEEELVGITCCRSLFAQFRRFLTSEYFHCLFRSNNVNFAMKNVIWQAPSFQFYIFTQICFLWWWFQ
jgi:hypothetical protein